MCKNYVGNTIFFLNLSLGGMGLVFVSLIDKFHILLLHLANLMYPFKKGKKKKKISFGFYLLNRRVSCKYISFHLLSPILSYFTKISLSLSLFTTTYHHLDLPQSR